MFYADVEKLNLSQAYLSCEENILEALLFCYSQWQTGPEGNVKW